MKGGLPGFWLRDPPDWRARLLQPLAALYRHAASRRRKRRQIGRLTRDGRTIPVLVVGNLFVGGTGKTPVVAWAASALAERGFRPGIVSRGYGGRARHWPQRVTPESDASRVGDEPALLARRTGLPVAVGPDRVAAARLLIDEGCDVLVSDDGLQHYRLPRTVEWVVFDGVRGVGNGLCLPAGPLREPLSRLQSVDLVLANGRADGLTPWWFALTPGTPRPVTAAVPESEGPPHPPQTVHAVAGIGNPERFFSSLEDRGHTLIRHPFPDHHPYRREDLDFADEHPILMTEKDAVKCAHMDLPRGWYLPVVADPAPETRTRMLASLDALTAGQSESVALPRT